MSKAGGAESFLPLDSEDMLGATLRLGRHIEEALDATIDIAGPSGEPRSVVVLGMGGSGVAGAVLQAFAAERSSVPVWLGEGYAAPAHADKDTLVFAVSFSGETEETLEAAATCVDQGARVIALTTGGSLAVLAAAAGGEVIMLPGGIPQPRAGVGAMVARLLLAAERLGVLPEARRDLEAAAEQLARRLPTLAGGDGEAAEVARRIGRTIPLVHGAAGLGAVAARRWKTQVNENAKAPAFAAAEPEVCHNEVCGYGQNGDVTRQLLTLVEVHLPGEHPRVSRRFDLMAELVDEAVGDIVRVRGEGGSELAGFFDVVAIGDVMSLHLAGNEGIDPGPVPILGEIKARLRGT